MSWDHEAADKIVHLIQQWSTIAVGLVGAVAAVGVTIAKALAPWLKRKREMAAVEQRSVNAWLIERVATLEREIEKEREESRKKDEVWQTRWADEVKARRKDSELFLKALERQRGASSAPPPTSNSTGTKTPK